MATSATRGAAWAKPLSCEALEGDLIQPGHALFGIIWVNRERLSGAPCFAGTRVPVQTLFDYLEAGDALQTFLDDFEGVARENAISVLELCSKRSKRWRLRRSWRSR